MVQNYRGRDARLIAETSRIRIVTVAGALALRRTSKQGRDISKLSVSSRVTIGVACPVALPHASRTSLDCRLFDVVSQRRPTLLGLARTVASSVPRLFSSDHEAANATMNTVSPICIEPLQIERPGLSVAQAERIDGSESGASLHGASSSARAEPPAPRRVQSAAGVEWKSRR